MRYDELMAALLDVDYDTEILDEDPVVIRLASGDVAIANVVWDAERKRLTLEAGNAVE